MKIKLTAMLAGLLCVAAYADSYDGLLKRYQKQIHQQERQLKSMRLRLAEKEKDIARWKERADEAKASWSKAAAALEESREAIQAVRTKRQVARRLADAAQWASTESVLVARSATVQAGVLAQGLYGQSLLSPGSPRITVEEAAPEMVYTGISQLSAVSRARSESARRQEAVLRGEELVLQNEEQKRSQEADRIHQKQEAQWLKWQEALRHRTALEDEISQIDQSAKALQVMLQELRDHRDQAQALKGDSAANGRAIANLRGTLPWPALGKVVEPYGRHYSDDLKQLVVSNGIKIETGAKHPVRVIQEGNVLFASPFRDYGRLVIVQHKNGLTSVYAGLGDVQVKQGQTLAALDPIGLTAEGGTFYFELRSDEQPINPLAYLTADKSSELSSRRTFR